MDETAQRTEAVPVPTGWHLLMRTLAATMLTAVGLLLAVWWLLDPSKEIRAPWLSVAIAALVAVPLAAHHLVKAPRPRRDKSVNPQRVKALLETSERTG